MASAELKLVLGILEKTAKEFNSMDEDADVALAGHGVEGCRSKLLERAQLIADLPSKVAVPVSCLKGNEEGLRFLLREQLTDFATMAKDRIDNKNIFGLGALLTSKGDGEGEKNHLEKLIDEVRKFN